MKNLFFALLPVLILALTSSNERTIQTVSSKTFVIVSEKANVVTSGTKYEADVFLYSVPENKPIVTFEGEEINIDENGVGKISFTAIGQAYDINGLAKKKYRGKMNVKVGGKKKELDFEQEYFVKRPIIEVAGHQTTALYKNCGNELNVQVSALEPNYAPAFKAEGAMVIPGAKKGHVTIVPSGSRVILTVASMGNTIGQKEFDVRNVPSPELIVYNDSAIVNYNEGVKASDIGVVRINCKPEEYFALNYPKDARYRVTEWVATLRRADQILESKTIEIKDGDLSLFKKKAQKGDRIVIEVTKITRFNFLNKQETLTLNSNNRIITISLY